MADQPADQMIQRAKERRERGASLDELFDKAIDDFAAAANQGSVKPLDLIRVATTISAMENEQEKAARQKVRDQQIARIRKQQVKMRKEHERHKQQRVKRGLIAEAGTGTAEPAFLLIQPSTRRRKLKLGASRLGGLPDLPQDIAWPTYRKKKLPFIAQISLSELPRPATKKNALLWPDGWLYVFGLFDNDPKHKPDPVAIFVHRGPSKALKRAKPPADEDIWPDWCKQRIYDPVPITLKPRPKGDKTLLGDSNAPSPLAGWLFGEVFGGFGTPGELANAAMKDGDDWINLLAVQSVGSMMWSDVGHLYLLIRRCDLRKGDFSQTLGVVRSG